MTALLCGCAGAHAQMVPRTTHLLYQDQASGRTSGITAVRIGWSGEWLADSVETQGLALKSHKKWPQWEGRIGAVMDRPINPVGDNFVLTQPIQAGLHMRSMHLLSDYYVDGGFRATLGLVSGEASQAWWSNGDHGGGLSISVQQIDSLGSPIGLGSQRGLTLPQPNAYVGAGYSSRLSGNANSETWRINADVGLLNTGTSSGHRLSGALQGERSLDEAVRSLRMRTILKLSLGYAF